MYIEQYLLNLCPEVVNLNCAVPISIWKASQQRQQPAEATASKSHFESVFALFLIYVSTHSYSIRCAALCSSNNFAHKNELCFNE